MESTIAKQSNMKNKLKMIMCRSCGGKMPKLRLTQYGYSFCITCSENGKGEGKKHGVPVMMGEGDHTWIETVIMDDAQFAAYERNETAYKNLDKTNKAELQNMDNEEKIIIIPTINDKDGE